MTAKEYLKQAKDIQNLIDAKKKQIQHLYDELSDTGVTFSHDKIKASGRKDKIASQVAAIIDLQNLLVLDATKLLRLKYDITIMIDQIESANLRWILFERYINFKDLRDIMQDCHMSKATIHRCHSKALEEFERHMSKN